MEIIKRKKLFLFGTIGLTTIAILIGALFFYSNSNECDCDFNDEKKSTNSVNSSYSLIYDENDIEIYEKKLNQSGDYGVFDIDSSDVKRIDKSTIDISNKFDCEWKGKEVDNYVIKESYCQIFKEAPPDANTDDWFYYKLLNINKDDRSNLYQVFIDDELIIERELKNDFGEPIQAIKFINNNFVVDYQTNNDTIPTEDVNIKQTKGHFSSIWINGKNVLENTEYIDAFSPNEINGYLSYFLSYYDAGDKKYILNYNEDLIDLPYKNIPHYGCCEESQFNIVSKNNVVDFFGRKEDGWYHVQIKGKE